SCCQDEFLPGREKFGVGWPKIVIVSIGAVALGLIVSVVARPYHIFGLISGFVAGFCILGASALVLPHVVIAVPRDGKSITLIKLLVAAFGALPGVVLFMGLWIRRSTQQFFRKRP